MPDFHDSRHLNAHLQAPARQYAEDIRPLDLREVSALLDEPYLPAPVHRLWKAFLNRKGYSPIGG